MRCCLVGERPGVRFLPRSHREDRPGTRCPTRAVTPYVAASRQVRFVRSRPLLVHANTASKSIFDFRPDGCECGLRRAFCGAKRRGRVEHRPVVRVEAAERAVRITAADPRIQLLGQFELSFGGRTKELPISCQRMLAFLALHESSADRTYLSNRLWFNPKEGKAEASLRSTLWRLRRHLGDEIVFSTRHRLQLDPSV